MLMDQRRIILASTSPYRRELLGRLGLLFEVAAPEHQEVLPSNGFMRPEQVSALVLENARGKALSVSRAHPNALILASDQLGECDGRILNKPGTAERAREQLLALTGKEHRLHTGVVLLDARSGRSGSEVVTNQIRLRPLSEVQIRRYIEQDQPLQCAGSYFMERLGIVLLEYVRGDDPTAVIGLPLIATCRLLEDFGIHPLGER
jgi:septum formation protein